MGFKDSSGQHAFYSPGGRQKEYNEMITKTPAGTLKDNLVKLRDAPSAIWLWGKAAIPDLESHLQTASAKSKMQTVVVIMYSIPNRDCAALASSGEICCKRNS